MGIDVLYKLNSITYLIILISLGVYRSSLVSYITYSYLR
jgi:hypothetical protein